MPTSFSQWWISLVRHPLVVVVSFSAVIALTACVILFAPRKYRSTSRLLIRIGHESASLDPTAAVAGDKITPVHTREDEVETAIGVMQSRSIAEEVVDHIGADVILGDVPLKPTADDPDKLPEEEPGLLDRIKGELAKIDPVSTRERAIRELQKGLDISAATKSSVVTVEYRAKDPALAQAMVGSWVDSYLRHHTRVNRTQGTYRFFLEEDARLRAELEQAHRVVREAKSSGGFVTLEGQQKLLETQLEAVRTELLQVESELAAAEARIDSLADLIQTKVDKTMTEELSGIASEAHDEMRGLLFQLEVLENEYASKLKPTHPKLAAIRDQLANATRIVNAQERERKQFRQTANPTHQQMVESQLLDIAGRDALERKLTALQGQRDELVEEINALNQHEEDLAMLQRNLDVLDERYKLHSVLLEQARLNEVLEENQITSINVVQPASLEERPVSPDKKFCAVLGLAAAFGLALGLPVVLDARRIYQAQAVPLAKADANIGGASNDARSLSELPTMSAAEPDAGFDDESHSPEDERQFEPASRPR